MNRQQVEDRLHADGTKFWRAALYDSIDLGTKWREVWFCASTDVSIAVDFSPPDPDAAQPSDVLRGVRLVRVGGEC